LTPSSDARYLHLGKAVKKNEQVASNYYKLVKFFNNHHIYSLGKGRKIKNIITGVLSEIVSICDFERLNML
jgi:hypothetical protein